MIKAAWVALLANLLSTPIHAQGSAGACELSGMVGTIFGDQLVWRFDPEKDRDEVYFDNRKPDTRGRFLAIRRSNDRLNVNLEIEDDQLGLIQVLIVLTEGTTESRVGAVFYSMADGERIVDVIVPFARANCIHR